jgi:4-hydroxybenzoate polyprenyltransferase
MKKIKSILALTRWTEIYDFNITLTLFGAIVAQGAFDLKFILILIANFFCLCHAFMFNDIEDAEEDAQNPKKLKRNPIANKSLSKKEGYFYSTITLIIAAVIFVVLGSMTNNIGVIIVGFLLLISNIVYSYRKIRFKAIPIIDVITHMFMLSSGPFLTAFYVYKNEMDLNGFILFLIFSGISAYGQLENETRDYETDVKTNVRTTAVVLGLKIANIIKFLFLGISSIAIIYLFLSTALIPNPLSIFLQVILFFGILSIFIYISFRKHKNQILFTRQLQQALLLAANLVLLLMFLKVSIF